MLGRGTPNPSLGIYFNRHILKIMFTVSRIYSNPYLHCWVAIPGYMACPLLGSSYPHVSRGEGESFVPQNPLILRDRVPSSSFLRPLASCFWDPSVSAFWGPRTSGSYWGPSRLLSKARVPSVFEVLVPPLRVFLLATQKSSQAQKSSNSNTYEWLYIQLPFL